MNKSSVYLFNSGEAFCVRELAVENGQEMRRERERNGEQYATNVSVQTGTREVAVHVWHIKFKFKLLELFQYDRGDILCNSCKCALLKGKSPFVEPYSSS